MLRTSSSDNDSTPRKNVPAHYCIALMLFLNFLGLCAIAVALWPAGSSPTAVKKAGAPGAPEAHGGALASKEPRRRLTADCTCYGTSGGTWSAATFGSTSVCIADLGSSDSQIANAGAMPDCQLFSTVNAHSTALVCASGGRRLEMEEEELPVPSVDEVLSKYLHDNSDFAAKMDAASVDKLKELGQHFGLPAHA